MGYQKKVLAPLEKCYSVGAFFAGGKERFLFASEVEAPCLSFNVQSLEREEIWSRGGGTMAMVPIPGSEDFLAIQGFFPPFAAAGAKLVWVSRGERGWQVTDYLALPYLHRFGILRRGGRRYLVLSTLCESKENKDDWSKPGHVYAAELSASPQEPPTPQPILDGLFHNHGFFTGCPWGAEAAAVASDQGVHLITPPERPDDPWSVRQLTDRPTGEVWLEDMDGDGQPELITIEAFHGSDLRVYHLDGEGVYRPVWQLPEKLSFAHALWCGRLWGQTCGICGSRRERAPLFRFYYEDGDYRTEEIEAGASPANVWVGEYQGRQCVLSANHGQNLCAMYLKDEK